MCEWVKPGIAEFESKELNFTGTRVVFDWAILAEQ